jgi:general stress protein 26
MTAYEQTEAEARRKVWDMIKDIKIATLVTHDGQGSLHARPMGTVTPKDEHEPLWFFSWETSLKIKDIQANPDVLLSYAEPDDQNYVSINGKATVVRDRAKIEELWSEAMRTWFPKGKDDPNIALIRIEPTAAEYWDSPSSTMIYAYGYLKARLTGEPPNPGENRRITL